jgi:hypothetical protein
MIMCSQQAAVMHGPVSVLSLHIAYIVSPSLKCMYAQRACGFLNCKLNDVAAMLP